MSSHTLVSLSPSLFLTQGDAPTSGRVFEALPSGCIPVVISPRQSMIQDLPFPSLIDWDSIALHTPSFKDILSTRKEVVGGVGGKGEIESFGMVRDIFIFLRLSFLSPDAPSLSNTRDSP